jgi:hypothetical protein
MKALTNIQVDAEDLANFLHLDKIMSIKTRRNGHIEEV